MRTDWKGGHCHPLVQMQKLRLAPRLLSQVGTQPSGQPQRTQAPPRARTLCIFGRTTFQGAVALGQVGVAASGWRRCCRRRQLCRPFPGKSRPCVLLLRTTCGPSSTPSMCVHPRKGEGCLPPASPVSTEALTEGPPELAVGPARCTACECAGAARENVCEC